MGSVANYAAGVFGNKKKKAKKPFKSPSKALGEHLDTMIRNTPKYKGPKKKK